MVLGGFLVEVSCSCFCCNSSTFLQIFFIYTVRLHVFFCFCFLTSLHLINNRDSNRTRTKGNSIAWLLVFPLERVGCSSNYETNRIVRVTKSANIGSQDNS